MSLALLTVNLPEKNKELRANSANTVKPVTEYRLDQQQRPDAETCIEIKHCSARIGTR